MVFLHWDSCRRRIDGNSFHLDLTFWANTLLRAQEARLINETVQLELEKNADDSGG